MTLSSRIELATFRTPLGWCAILGRGQTLAALTLAHRSADAAVSWLAGRHAADARLSAWNWPLQQRIVAMLEGEPDEFRDIDVALDHLTSFQRRVVAACRRIAWGQTRSYGQLATVAGSPGAARAVGQVMAANRTPLVVPCHRVLASGGRLGGYSAPQGLRLKRRLLELEAGELVGGTQ